MWGMQVLDGDLIEDIYTHQSQVFVKYGAEHKVYTLKKSLSGLWEPIVWNAKIHDNLIKVVY